MNNRKTLFVTGSLVFACFTFGLFARKYYGGEPQFKNLKVLPKDISREDLKKAMGFFSKALNVKCNFCHAESTENPGKLDFASDINAHHKEDARHMMMMTNELNIKYFGYDPADSKSVRAINCYTCHRGEQEPIAKMDTTMQVEKH